MQQVVDYCNRYGLKHVPIYFIGQAKELYANLYCKHEYKDNLEAFAACGCEEDDRITGRNWHNKFLELLSTEYLEKDDIYCNTKGLPDEGIVLSKRIDVFEGLKLKSFKFLEGETKELDKEQENIEDNN